MFPGELLAGGGQFAALHVAMRTEPGQQIMLWVCSKENTESNFHAELYKLSSCKRPSRLSGWSHKALLEVRH